MSSTTKPSRKNRSPLGPRLSVQRMLECGLALRFAHVADLATVWIKDPRKDSVLQGEKILITGPAGRIAFAAGAARWRPTTRCGESRSSATPCGT